MRFDWNSVMGSTWDVGAWVRNLADEEAVISSSLSTRSMPVRSVLYNEPRVYGMSIRYRFGAEAR
jgi:iron complex outermembrane receptor protein